MKIIRILVLSLLFVATVLDVSLKADDENSSYYIQMKVVGRDGADIEYFDEAVRGGCYITLSESCNGMFYLNSEGGSGYSFGSMYSDNIQSQQNHIVFEMLYNLTVVRDKGQLYLKGLLYSLHYGDGNTIKRGRKYVVNQQIFLDTPSILPFLEVPDHRELALQVTVNSEGKSSSKAISTNLLQINSVCHKDGKLAGKFDDRLHIDRRSISYMTNFDLGKKNGKKQTLIYQVAARLSKNISDITEPTECEVVFKRDCVLRSFNQEEEVVSSGLSFTSTITKTVTINPGEQLKLIFPPESPPIQGIEIEDTLTINPR